MLFTPHCYRRQCEHYRGVHNDGDETTERVYCKAFPDRIPDEIAYGENPHTAPYPGDNGIQYQRSPKAAG